MRGQQLAMLLRRSPRTECWATPEQRRLVFVVTCKPRRSVESAHGPTQVREEVRPQQLRIHYVARADLLPGIVKASQ